MKQPWELLSSDYYYDLPAFKIASHPLPERDRSRLLISRGGRIAEDVFTNIASHLPSDALLLINDTRVVYARLLFQKDTGARVEIFCLEPIEPVSEITQAFSCQSGVVWRCLIGNARRLKAGHISMQSAGYYLNARILKWEKQEALVHFEWRPAHLPFSAVLASLGKVPLPPYLQREPEAEDNERYQTSFARQEGSVAAPTAGLHFTEAVFRSLETRGIKTERLTLHVGAGTFRPVTTKSIGDHDMHREQISITRQTILALLNHQGPVVALGTTSVRVLESLYWYGQALHYNQNRDFEVKQWEPYRSENHAIDPTSALQAILRKMDKTNEDILQGSTQLIIVPGYHFKMIDGMITNFHLPGSTLLMLVSAFLGDHWKTVYQYALERDFRFLSYGDACLFLPLGAEERP